MFLKQISLINFRSFSHDSFNFNPHLSIILGENSVGKTNLLEAIYFISKAHGFREKQEEELLKTEESLTDVQAVFEDTKNTVTCRIHLSQQSTVTKTCFIDRVKKRTFDYITETLPIAVFSPNLVYVIDGDISERREFFDSILMLIDKEYKKRLTNYMNALKKRNKVLEKVTDIVLLKEQLSFWDDYLIKEADYITQKRDFFIAELNKNPEVQDKSFAIKYIKNAISKATLEETFQKQLYVRRTVVGPQRDSYEIFLNNPASEPHPETKPKNVHKYGSRSEQRLALFWILLNEIKLYEKFLKQRPLILLDDIFSELDESNKSLVLNLISDYQTIVTTTEDEISELTDIEKTIIHLK